MRGWVNKDGEYFESQDNCIYSSLIAKEFSVKPSVERETEIKILKAMDTLLRKQASESIVEKVG
jgi:hypothetical protein